MAVTSTVPMKHDCARKYLKPVFEKSASVSGWTTSRARGPQMPMQQVPAVMSRMATVEAWGSNATSAASSPRRWLRWRRPGTARGQPGDGDVGPDAAVDIEHQAVGHGADRFRHLAGDQASAGIRWHPRPETSIRFSAVMS